MKNCSWQQFTEIDMTGLQNIIDLIHRLDERLDAGRSQGDNWRETDHLLSSITSDLKRQLARERLLTGSVTEFSHAYSQLVNEISMLGNVSHVLESSPTPTDLFDRLPQLLRKEFRADSVSIMLLEKESQTLETVGASLIEELEEGSGVSIPVGEGVAGWVARYRRPWLVRDTTSDRQFKVYTEARVHPRALLSVPIIRHDHTIGVINLGSESADFFTQRHEELLVIIANLLAVSIGSARLYEELESHISYQNRELIEVRDFLENVINNSDDVIVVFDTYQKILMVSPSVNGIFGHEVDDLVGSHITALLTDGSAFSRLVKMMDQEEVLRDLDMVIPHRDGHDIPTTGSTDFRHHPAVWQLLRSGQGRARALPAPARHRAAGPQQTGRARRVPIPARPAGSGQTAIRERRSPPPVVHRRGVRFCRPIWSVCG